MIKVNNLSKKFKNKILYENVSFHLKDNHSYALVGKSGTGKTTLLNMLSGLEYPDSGQIIIDDKELNKNSVQFFRKDTFGYIFQNYGLIDTQTIYDNLMIGLQSKKKGKSKKELFDLMNQQLRKFDLDYLSLNDRIYTLSGGEQQRIALIRIILRHPKIVFADEPTGSLDKSNAKIIVDHLLSDLKDSLLIIATHDMDIAKRCDYQIIIYDNKIDIIKNK